MSTDPSAVAVPQTAGNQTSVLSAPGRWLVALVGIAAVALGVWFGRGWVASLMGDKPLEELLVDCRSEDEDTRVSALLAMGRHPEYLPQSLEGVLPNLIHPKDTIRISAESAVRSLGEAVTPHLRSWLEADRPDKFYMGCAAITALGTKAREYIPILIAKLDSPDFATRMSCLFALESMGKEAQPAFDKLLTLLDVPDPEFNIQVRVCYIFRNLGDGARPAIPRLMRLAEEGVLSSRSMAYLTLGALGPSPDHDIVGLLTKRLDAFHLLDRERALIGLGYLGKEAQPALDKIEGLMGNPEKSAQAQAAFAYWRITGETERPLKVLAECLESYDFRMNAVDRAGDMGAVASSLVPKMITLLDEPDDEALREAVILAFGKMGPAAKGAVSKLKSLAGYDDDLLMRETARIALESIEPQAGGSGK